MSLPIQQNISLANETTMKVGGPAEYFVVVESEAELVEAVKWAEAEGLSVTILGGGSNVLVSDSGLKGLVIKNCIGGFVAEESEDVVSLTVGAGEVLDDVVERTVAVGWWGLENLSHIPGSVGAVPIQNVGAYGVEAKDVVTSVRVYDMAEKSFQDFSVADCQFGYRDSVFKREEGKSLIVTAVTFSLLKTPRPQLTYRDLAQAFPEGTEDQLAIREAVITIRNQKFPDWHTVGTAGSFFKNPVVSADKAAELTVSYPELPQFPSGDGRVKLALGYILDKICHLKGVNDGPVGTYAGQALVLVNNGGATTQMIYDFAQKISSEVESKTGITIEWEVTKLG